MWANHLLSRFFWLVKCPKSSTKQILNGNCIILTLRAWQRSNSIVYQHKDRLFKSNQVKLLEMIREDMKCKDSSPKWYEMIWKDVKGYEKILTEPNICKGLFTRMIGVPFLMWQGQTHATVSGHFSSVYDLAWPKSSKIILICYISSIYSVGLAEGTASCFDLWILWIKIAQFWKSSLSPVLMSGHAALSRSKVRSKSLWPSSTCSIPCQHKAN